MKLVDLAGQIIEINNLSSSVNGYLPGYITDDIEKEKKNIKNEVEDIYDKWKNVTIPKTQLSILSEQIYQYSKGSWVLLPSGIQVTEKVLKQLFPRGWTIQGIEDAFTNPYYTCEATNLRTGNPARAYYRTNVSGDYVVIDLDTMETVQIGKSYDPNWKPNSSMRNPIWGLDHRLPPGYFGPDLYGRWPY